MAKYNRYRSANTWQELGLIGDTLLFTDDDIVTQQAIGYTKDLCKFNCPMDIAVVYSMLNQGEGATPTAKELLNDYTRLAYYFEAGKIADGWYRPPLEQELYSCSSDVIFPRVDYRVNSYSNLNHAPPIDVTKLEGLITAILENKDATTMSYLLDAYNWEGHYRQQWWRNEESIYSEFLMADRTDNADFKALMSNGEDEQVSATKVLELIQQYIPFAMKPNSDWCTRSDDDEHFCETHNPNMTGYERQWVFKEGLPELNENFPVSEYECGKVQMHKQECDDTIPFEEHERTLIQEVDDKLVLRLINKSLTRMVKRGTVEQVTHGRGRMFQWTAWGWLQQIRTHILASNAKQRKLGDVVNGWEYTKGRTRMSYGMEINDHDWKPVEQLQWWSVRVLVPYMDDWNQTRMYYKKVELPHMFFDEASAQSYKAMLESSWVVPTDGISRHKTVDADYNVSFTVPKYRVVGHNEDIAVDGTAVIEEYATPLEMFIQMQNGNEQAYEAIKSKLRDAPSKKCALVVVE
tara:strand:+ start:928 stop:2487 length:1560 start_codon:yes stop_codon:yes gene_type:complete